MLHAPWTTAGLAVSAAIVACAAVVLSSCSGVVDPYSGACLTTPAVVLPCDAATSNAKCGCATCALPGCATCVTQQCERGTLSRAGGSCDCPAGWTSEFPEFPCTSASARAASAFYSSSAAARVQLASAGAFSRRSAVRSIGGDSLFMRWAPPIAMTLLAMVIAHFFVFSV